MELTKTNEGTAVWRTIRLDVLARAEQLPSLSSVVTELLEITKRPFFTAKDFEAVICKDQALVVRLLKAANSGQYGKAGTVSTIPEAVLVIGLENILKIVHAVNAAGLMRHGLRCYDYEPERGFWLHSMGVAMTARALAASARWCKLTGEEAFVAGLLHDVGKLVIDDFLDDSNGPHHVTIEEERAACGLDHAELAEHVFTNWNIPEALIDSVRDHHLVGDRFWRIPEAVLINLAHQVCQIWHIGWADRMDLGIEVRPDDFLEHLDALGIDKDGLAQILWEVRQSLAGLDALYERECGDQGAADRQCVQPS